MEACCCFVKEGIDSAPGLVHEVGYNLEGLMSVHAVPEREPDGGADAGGCYAA